MIAELDEYQTGDRGRDAAGEDIADKGYRKAVSLLRQCSTPDGFVASPEQKDNYRRIWSRDGVIIGLAALMSGDSDLVETFKKTLQTLSLYQGPHGEIPSNVNTKTGRISYGTMIGRVDADLWFIIGCAEYWLESGDNDFIIDIMPALERAFFLLGAWEFNSRGLIYVPETGDWADEYLHSGFVLYDQLLYLQAQRGMYILRSFMNDGKKDDDLLEKTRMLGKRIVTNYWLDDSTYSEDCVYHDIIYKKGRQARGKSRNRFWFPFFTPHGYGYRFDSFANILASLLNVALDWQVEAVDGYIADEIANKDCMLIPAFSPVIKPVDSDWEDLQMTFSYTFKNRPYEYHNGGLWPMLTGFYIADLAARGQDEKAARYLDAVHRANALAMDDEGWSFPEYVHGREYTAGGTRHQGWSAAGAVIGSHVLEKKPLFRTQSYE